MKNSDEEESKTEKVLELIGSLNNIINLDLISKEIDKKRELTDYILLPETKNHPAIIIDQNISYKNKKWAQTNDLLRQEDAFMLSPGLFAEFLKLLKSEKELYDGLGNLIDGSKIKERILKGILDIRNPWRAEWLDHKYSGGNNKLAVTYHKFDSSGKLIQVTEPLDKDTLIKNRDPGISLEDWINNQTNQGLPKKTVNQSSLWYWPPTENYVAGFFACADWIYLNCFSDPNVSDLNLGARSARLYQKK